MKQSTAKRVALCVSVISNIFRSLHRNDSIDFLMRRFFLPILYIFHAIRSFWLNILARDTAWTSRDDRRKYEKKNEEGEEQEKNEEQNRSNEI